MNEKTAAETLIKEINNNYYYYYNYYYYIITGSCSLWYCLAGLWKSSRQQWNPTRDFEGRKRELPPRGSTRASAGVQRRGHDTPGHAESKDRHALQEQGRPQRLQQQRVVFFLRQ